MFYNTGHGHLGWTLSAVTADMVGDLIANSARQNNNAGALSAGSLSRQPA